MGQNPVPSLPVMREMDREVLNEIGVAQLLRISDKEAVELMESGSFTTRNIGGKWRASRRSVMDWLGGH